MNTKSNQVPKLNNSFAHKIYKTLLQVPKGYITTYKDLGEATFGKKFKGYRAVGSALNKNPFAPIVPCHRVINSNGKLGGFAFGNKEKIKHLTIERIEITTDKNKQTIKIKNFKEKLWIFKKPYQQ